jgi:hypothetical protein
MYEYGYTVPQGGSHVKRIRAVLDEPGADLPVLVVEECRDLLEQIGERSTRINLKTEKVKQLALKADKAAPKKRRAGKQATRYQPTGKGNDGWNSKLAKRAKEKVAAASKHAAE